jgi:hypothetical protein
MIHVQSCDKHFLNDDWDYEDVRKQNGLIQIIEHVVQLIDKV